MEYSNSLILLNENMDLHVFTMILPAALAQIMMPDVRFNEQNDRFDLSSLMQQGTFDQWKDVMDVRRADGVSDNNDKDITNATAKFMVALKAFQQYSTTEHSGDEGDPSDPSDPNEKPKLRRDFVAYIFDFPRGDARRSETRGIGSRDTGEPSLRARAST